MNTANKIRALGASIGFMPLDGSGYTTPPGYMPTYTPGGGGTVSDQAPVVSQPSGGIQPGIITPIPVSLTNPDVTAADTTLQPIPTVAPGAPAPTAAPTGMPAWILPVAAGALILVLMSKKKKRGGSVAANFDYSKLIIPGILLVGGYFVLSKLGLFGSQDLADVNQQFTDQQATADQQALQNLKNQGQPPTINDSEALSLANDIYNQGTSSVFTTTVSDQAQANIIYDFFVLRNTADLYALKAAFGTKKAAASWYSTCALLGFNCTAMNLDAFVKLALSPDGIAMINNIFAQHAINYTL